jgi:hypothetical protein
VGKSEGQLDEAQFYANEEKQTQMS